MTLQLTHKKPCVDSLFLVQKRFRLIDGAWIREDKFIQRTFTNQQITLKREVKLIVHKDIDPVLGTEIEVFINGTRIGTGYWTTRKDFLSTFTL